MKRVLCCMMCLALILALAAPVSAAENNFMELLDFATVNDQGHNRFQFTTTSTIKVSLPMLTPLKYVDVLFLADDNTIPTSVSVRYNSAYTNLTVKKVTSDIYRAYGTISGEYKDLYLRFNAGGTQTYTIMSCKVSAVSTSRTAASATFQVQLANGYHNATIGTPFERSPDDFYDAVYYNTYYQATIGVSDATKFDLVHLQFAVNYATINSIRVTYGGTSVPFTFNFIDVESDSAFITYYENIGEGTINNCNGKVIGSITADLSGIERNKNQYLYVYFNGDFYTGVGLYVNVSGVEGEVLFADTKEASWWSWAKDLLSNIKSLPERIAEELGKLYQPDEGKLDAVQQQSQELAEDRLGAVYQAGQVVDGLVGAFQNQTATEFLTVPVLTVPLGEVDWTIGGWSVQVVPDAFKPIVETLKIVIDIVCTLGFVKSMRNRFERMLSGGNA